jgi:hypothetical protein
MNFGVLRAIFAALSLLLKSNVYALSFSAQAAGHAPCETRTHEPARVKSFAKAIYTAWERTVLVSSDKEK